MSTPDERGRVGTGAAPTGPVVPEPVIDLVVDEAGRRFEEVRAADFDTAAGSRSGDGVDLAKHRTDETDPDEAQDADRTTPTMWEQMGGPMGMVDSGLPVLVFIVANVIGGLGWGIGMALGAGLLIAILRLLRKQPVTQAIGGLFGVGIAAFIASRTGEARGFFLLGIWTAVLYGGVLLVSIVVRWPLVGVLWESLNGRGTTWRSNRRLVRLYDYATAVWVVVFALRFVVQQWLYDENQVGWLAAAKIAMGTPLFLVAILITVLIVGSAAGMKLPGWLSRDKTKR